MLRSEIKITEDKNKRIGIIYSLDELFVYVVKICYQGESHYIGDNKSPTQFGNIKDAKRVCLEQKVDEMYLALSNTYQEVDPRTDTPLDPAPRYDYQKISF